MMQHVISGGGGTFAPCSRDKKKITFFAFCCCIFSDYPLLFLYEFKQN